MFVRFWFQDQILRKYLNIANINISDITKVTLGVYRTSIIVTVAMNVIHALHVTLHVMLHVTLHVTLTSQPWARVTAQIDDRAGTRHNTAASVCFLWHNKVLTRRHNTGGMSGILFDRRDEAPPRGRDSCLQ